MAKVYKVDETFDHTLFIGASCAFGVFDGVHRGHRFLIDQAKRTAAESGGKSIALTFDIDPDERFHADRLKKLMTNEQRVKALADTGVDCVVVLPFTPAFSSQSPMAFMDATFGGCAPYAMHVGTDFRFGAKAAGTVSELHEWGDSRGTRICSHDLESFDGRPITLRASAFFWAIARLRRRLSFWDTRIRSKAWCSRAAAKATIWALLRRICSCPL